MLDARPRRSPGRRSNGLGSIAVDLFERGAVRAAILGAIVALTGCRRVDENAPRPRVDTRPEATDTGAPPAPPPTGTTVVVPDFANVADRVSPSVVTVLSTVRDRGDGGSKAVRGVGSGVVVSAAGQVLTNEHVVAQATGIDVELPSNTRLRARVLAAEPRLDLALLELEGDAPELVPIELSQRPPRPGEWVMAVGQPFNLGHSVTVGVISGMRRNYDDVGRPEGLRPEGVWSFIQTDAPINIGNSGGPLVDVDGKVVGIATAARNDGQGLAFAIPAPMVKRFLEDVWTHGRVRMARLGIKAEDTTTDAVPGRWAVVRITRVDEGGPGAKAQLEPGDLILEIDSQPVERSSDVAYLTQLAGVGAKVTMTIARSGQPPEQVIVIPAESK